MKDQQFTEYTERCIALGRGRGWEKEIKAKEALAWHLHARFPPTGSFVLGHLFLEQKISYLKPDIVAKEFAKDLVVAAQPAMQAMEHKDGWDHYYLGVSHAYGRGVARDYRRAAEAFAASHQEGNPYAEFEAIWARHLAGGPRLEALLNLLSLRGELADFAALSARALALLETGPVREVGSHCHIVRLLLLRSALHDFIYHDHGARQVRIAITKEFRAGVDELRRLDTPRGHLALYLTARASAVNPTGAEPMEWFRKAVHPEVEEIEVLCKRQELDAEELRLIVQRAEVEGWTDSSLACAATQELECLEA